LGGAVPLPGTTSWGDSSKEAASIKHSSRGSEELFQVDDSVRFKATKTFELRVTAHPEAALIKHL
jgi:hypothetical protein